MLRLELIRNVRMSVIFEQVHNGQYYYIISTHD